MESINNFFDNFFNQVQQNPQWAGAFIFVLAFFMLIAVIMDADWMLEGGNARNIFNIATISKRFGRNVARILMGLLCIALMIAGVIFYFLYPQGA